MLSEPANIANNATWRRRLRWLILVSLSAGTLTCLVNCTPQTRYKTLSFFFDGVPNPDAPAQTNNNNSDRQNNNIVIASSHKPFDDENCGACHAGSSLTGSMRGFDTFKKLTAEICSKCHPQVTKQYRYMHGPVVNSVCLMCHDPHEANQPHLLKLPAAQLCLQCHQIGDLGPPAEAHNNPKIDCLTCHVGHGSDRHGLLRVSAMLPEIITVPQPTAPQSTPTEEPTPTSNSAPTTGDKL